jgi:small subunit ribosomal protein S16
MVRIRLRRVGAKKQPHYRVVVADQRSPRDGRHIETIGYYNPRTEPETVKIKEDRALYWLSQGAQPSEVVRHMLEKQGTIARLTRLKAGEAFEALVSEYEAVSAAVEGGEPVEVEAVEEPAAVEAEAEAAEPEAQATEPEATAKVEEEAGTAEVEEAEATAETDEASSEEALPDQA